MFRLIVRVAALFSALLLPIAVRGQATTGNFVLVSDIHFDPFFDGSLFGKLAAEPVDRWAKIFDKSEFAVFNSRGTDSNYALMKSSLDDLQQRCPDPDFILYPGDFMAHYWLKEYDSLARRSHLDDPQAYRDFTAKVIRFMAEEFRQRYPDTAILPTLGNDDSFCGDYMIAPEGAFLKMFAAVWQPLLGSRAAGQGFRESFAKGGYYSIKLPQMTNHRLVVLNTVFFSIKYNNACGTSVQTPALDQLTWLAQTLETARAKGESVWLLMHVPPGVNSYSSRKSVDMGGPAVGFWQPELTSQYLSLVQQYQETIQTAFAGHTHADDFRVIQFDGRPVLLTKIAPSISPIFGNNPGYQVYNYSRHTGELQNYQTFYLTNLQTDGKPTLSDAAQWSLEYDFRKTYLLPAVNAQTVATLTDTMSTEPAIAAAYRNFYGVSAPALFEMQALEVYRCAITNVTLAEFQNCYSGGDKPKRSPRPVGLEQKE